MRWNAKDPFRWRKSFAWLPVKIGDERLWWDWYWWRDQCLYRQVAFATGWPNCCDEMRGDMWLDGELKPAWCPVHGTHDH